MKEKPIAAHIPEWQPSETKPREISKQSLELAQEWELRLGEFLKKPGLDNVDAIVDEVKRMAEEVAESKALPKKAAKAGMTVESSFLPGDDADEEYSGAVQANKKDIIHFSYILREGADFKENFRARVDKNNIPQVLDIYLELLKRFKKGEQAY